LVLVEGEGGLRIERSDKLGGEGKVFLDKIKKPTLKVGFLNALFGERDFLKGVDRGDLENLLIPLPSRLRINQIEKNFRVLEKLKSLEKLVNLEISQITKN